MPQDKILVGMSGGVDSSVCAALLKEKGYDVAGVTLRLYDTGSSNERDAADVCEKLKIKHYVFDFRDKFKNLVLDNFINEYNFARTPNPCIVCNKTIKFGSMLEKAQEMGFDKIATGHYGCIEESKNGRFILSRANDKTKDQSYVLYSLSQEQLSHILLPLASFEKSKIRSIAESLGLKNADKPDSQDICFVPDGNYAKFIESYCGKKANSGNFIDTNGNVLGLHNGIIRYTVGQRKGLGIALGKPAFVLDKNYETNCVTLGDEQALFYRRVLIKNVNFIPFDNLNEKMRVKAKLRYRHTEQPAYIYTTENNNIIIEFDEPQRAPSPGQTAVFYDGDMVVGGGIIVKGID